MACPTPVGRVLEVGPGKTYTKPSEAAAVTQSGDTVHIAAGDYRGDVAFWGANNLTICGIGGRARLFADGNHAQGKGTWVIDPSNSATTTVVNVEFHDAKVPDQNGAGIRLDGGSLILRNTGFYDNENGILGGVSGTSVTIEYSEFARNGFGDGFTHNLYIGPVDRLTVKASYFHHAKIGHNLKSRGKEAYIENSYFLDGTTGTSSYLLDFPNGGLVYMRGNLLHKGPNADNSIAISFWAEPGAGGVNWPVNTVTLVHNTIVSTYPGGTYIYAPANTQSLTLTANLFAGNAGTTTGGVVANVPATNKFTTAANVPNAATANFWPVASLLSQLGLATVPDLLYVEDTPQPMTTRAIGATSRIAGALQSTP